MLLQELIGKKITNLYQIIEFEPYGIDFATCFVELDNELIIDIPFCGSDDIWVRNLYRNAEDLFKNPKNKLLINNIQNKIIIDFLWYNDSFDKGFLQLDNGYIITDNPVAMNGTAQAGFHIYANIGELPTFGKILNLKDK